MAVVAWICSSSRSLASPSKFWHSVAQFGQFWWRAKPRVLSAIVVALSCPAFLGSPRGCGSVFFVSIVGKSGRPFVRFGNFRGVDPNET